MGSSNIALMEHSFDRQDHPSSLIGGHIDELGDGGVDMLAFDVPLGHYIQGHGLALF